MEIGGVDFDALVSLTPNEALLTVLDGSTSCGLQSTQLGRARTFVQDTLKRRKAMCSGVSSDPSPVVICSYTSNLISCGLRETLAYLARHRLVDAFVATAGGVEEDVIKCLGKTLVGDFTLVGKELRAKGLNRIGNLLVPNDNYCAFEDFFVPVIRTLHAKQQACKWSAFTGPSEIIHATGEAMESLANREESVVYWCYKNAIPMFCPALTDGSMGDMIYFYNFSKKGFMVDPVPDSRKLAELCRVSSSSVALIFGGGLPKNHVLRAMRAVPLGAQRQFLEVTTGSPVDGCASSCNADDDLVEGLLRSDDEVIRLHGDAALFVPLLL